MDLFSNIIAATVLFFLSLALIGIGWLITGKMKIKPGSCGRAPKDKSCKESKCSLCEEDKEKD